MKVGLHFSCSAINGASWPELYHSALEQAEIADDLGFDSAVVSEHHFKQEGWIPSPLVLCGAVAARTRRLRVGTDIVILPFAHPLRVAEDILTLDNLSRGRAILGAGMGHSEAEFAAFGIPYRQRVSRTEEALQVIRTAFDNERFSFGGRFSRFDEITVTPRPAGPTPPPIWYGAISVPGARRAARLADALVIGPSLPTTEVADVTAAYREELAAQGRTGEVHLRREIALYDTSRRAWTDGIGPLHYQATRIYSDFPADASMDQFTEFARERYLVGDTTEVTDQIHELREKLNIDGLLLRFQLPGTTNEDAVAATRLFGERILGSL